MRLALLVAGHTPEEVPMVSFLPLCDVEFIDVGVADLSGGHFLKRLKKS